MALEQKVVDLQQELVPLRRKLRNRSVDMGDGHLNYYNNHSGFRNINCPSNPSDDLYVNPSVHSPQVEPYHCEEAHCRYSVSHYEAWYDSELCRSWLDGPDGVLVQTLDIVELWHEGTNRIIKSFEKIQAAHPQIAPWNAKALVGAFTRTHTGNSLMRSCDPEAIVDILEKIIITKFTVEPASIEILVNAMDDLGTLEPDGHFSCE